MHRPRTPARSHSRTPAKRISGFIPPRAPLVTVQRAARQVLPATKVCDSLQYSNSIRSNTSISANSICYYDNPTPKNGNYRIPAGGNNVVVYPFFDNSAAAVWNGNWGFCEDGKPKTPVFSAVAYWFRMQLGMTCNKNATACDSAGCGVASGPYGIAEVNLIKNGSDYYDISNIAGVSIPMSITPDEVPAASMNSADPYTCGNPGSLTPNTTGLGASTWDFTVPSVEYQWVTAGNGSAKTCSADTDCSSGESCGLVYTSGAFGLTCGTLSGYWTGGGVSLLVHSAAENHH